MPWIKMRTNLWDDPRVAAMADAIGTSEAPIIGALYWLWSAADEHTSDGFLQRMTLSMLDRKVGIEGFGEALKSVCWIEIDGDGLRILNHAEHNGKTAKARAQAARRQEKNRVSGPAGAPVTQVSRTERDKSVTGALPRGRGRVRGREEGGGTPPNPPPRPDSPEFTRFWSAYPRKTDKAAARRSWKRQKLDVQVAAVLNGLDRAVQSRQWTTEDGRFIPYPATWLNRQGWTEHPDPVRGDEVPIRREFTDDELDEFLGGGDG